MTAWTESLVLKPSTTGKILAHGRHFPQNTRELISNCYISLRTRIKTALHDKKNSVKELTRQHDRIPNSTTENTIPRQKLTFPRHNFPPTTEFCSTTECSTTEFPTTEFCQGGFCQGAMWTQHFCKKWTCHSQSWN